MEVEVLLSLTILSGTARQGTYSLYITGILLGTFVSSCFPSISMTSDGGLERLLCFSCVLGKPIRVRLIVLVRSRDREIDPATALCDCSTCESIFNPI